MKEESTAGILASPFGQMIVSFIELRNRGACFREKKVRSVFNMVIFEEPVELASGNAQ